MTPGWVGWLAVLAAVGTKAGTKAAKADIHAAAKRYEPIISPAIRDVITQVDGEGAIINFFYFFITIFFYFF